MLLTALGLGLALPAWAAGPVFLFGSDLKGQLSNQIQNPQSPPAGLLHLKDQILAQRAQGPTLWLDGGESLEGSPLSQELGEQSPFVALFLSLKPDVVVPGERDLAHLKLPLPWTAANLTLEGQPLVPPYRVFERAGKKIVVLGLIHSASSLWRTLPPGWKIEEPLESARHWVPLLRAQEHPDRLVLVLHAGRYEDRDQEAAQLLKTKPPLGAQAIGEQVPGIDLILHGHDGWLYPKGPNLAYAGTTALAGGGSLGRGMLALDWEEKGWSLRQLAPRPLPLEAVKAAFPPAFLELWSRPLGWRIRKSSKVKLAACLNSLAALAVKQPGAFGSALPEVYLKGSSRFGLLYYAQLYDWFPFPDGVQTLALSKRDLSLLARPAAPFGRRKANPARRVFLSLSSPLDLSLDPWLVSGSDQERRYKILLSDYHLRGGSGILPMLFLPAQPEVGGKPLRTWVSLYLQSHQPLPPSCTMLEPAGPEAYQMRPRPKQVRLAKKPKSPGKGAGKRTSTKPAESREKS